MKQTVYCGIILLCCANVFANPVIERPSNLVNNVGSCRDGYSQPFESNWTSCYRVYRIDTSAGNAASKCQLDGGYLTSVPNAFVNSYLNSLATELDVTYMTLGISCTNGVCVNEDGTKVQYTNFLPGQQSVGCAFMSTLKKDRQKWYLWDCTLGEFFGCEIPAGYVQKYTCPQDYSYFEGACYRVVNTHPNNISANAAAAECKKIPRGNLATVFNEELNNFLAQLQPHKVYETVFGLFCPNITKDGDTSSCKWDDGTPFEYKSFRWGNWNGRYWYFPLAEAGSGCCEFNGGKWEDCYPCDDPNRFDSYICQAPEQFV